MNSICIVGFDSAWGDRAQGAICSITLAKDGAVSFAQPRCSTFKDALEFITSPQCKKCDACIVAIDQPTIVPNDKGGRPVDRIAGSVVGFTGGGVQMARRSKADLFGDDAPIWRFLRALPAIQNPEESRIAHSGLFVIEVLPALALPAFNDKFCEYRKGPKYNPAKKSQFRQSDWCAVIETIAKIARAVPIEGLEDWALETAKIERPRKSNQDQIDAVVRSYRLSLANQAPRTFDHDRRSNQWLHGFTHQRGDNQAP